MEYWHQHHGTTLANYYSQLDQYLAKLARLQPSSTGYIGQPGNSGFGAPSPCLQPGREASTSKAGYNQRGERPQPSCLTPKCRFWRLSYSKIHYLSLGFCFFFSHQCLQVSAVSRQPAPQALTLPGWLAVAAALCDAGFAVILWPDWYCTLHIIVTDTILHKAPGFSICSITYTTVLTILLYRLYCRIAYTVVLAILWYWP